MDELKTLDNGSTPEPNPVLLETGLKRVGFFHWFWALCFRSIATLEESLPIARYRKTSAFLVGVGVMVIQLLNRFELSGQSGLEIPLILLGGLLCAPVYYYIGGTVYHILVKLAGGKGPAKYSRTIFIYASLPGNMLYILVGVAQYLLLGQSDSIIIYQAVGIGWVFSAIMLTVMQIKLQFTGAVVIHKANTFISMLLFISVPLGYNVYVLLQTFASL